MEGIISIVFIILMGIFSGKLSGKAHVREAVKRQAMKPENIKGFETAETDAAVRNLGGKAYDKLAAKRRNEAFAKTTLEKTHSHEGEVEGFISLSEDRKNDWLARQIREENKAKRMLE